MTNGAEASASFDCFGSTCAAIVAGDGTWGRASDAVTMARRRLLAWHRRFSRFEASSELSRLNDDPRAEVPVSGAMATFVAVVLHAARTTGGLVDATLLRELEVTGYVGDLPTSVPLPEALALAAPRRRAGPSPAGGWRRLRLDPVARTVTRPPGLALDSGGLAKGLVADLLANALAAHASFAVDCAGDLRVGGAAGVRREVLVASPFDGEVVHAFELADAGVATSGIGRRSWLDADGAPAHHLLDPATGRPAFTGVVQATALAPSATEAELRAKAAVLSGPEGARGWLPHGGVVVLDDGRHEVFDPRLAGAAAQ